MTAPAEEDELTELVDFQGSRLDAVRAGANGIPRFLIAKQDGASAGLLDPEFVRDLIAKADPEPSGRERVEMPNGVTLSGSPADIAAFIHKAAERDREREAAGTDEDADVAKKKMSSKAINDLPDSDFAYIESGGHKDESGKTTPRSLRHFPVHDAAHVRNALARLSSSPFGDKASGKVHAAAKKFGIKVSKEAGAADVSKADPITDPDLDGGTDGMDPTVPFRGPDGDDAPGDPTVPGSPAWEAIDAATACKWLAIASRLQNALSLLSDREMLEAATADPDDEGKAWDLQDAMCALDYVIGVLAVFAAQEQAEAELGTEAAVKSAAGCDGIIAPGLIQIVKAMADEGLPGALEAAEACAAIAKAGRVLSSANEAAIRGAVEQLQKVLASLPEAPVAKEAGQMAADSEEGAMPETSADRAEQSGQEPVMGSAPPGGKPGKNRKKKGKVAKGLPVAVFGPGRDLLGVVARDVIVSKADDADSTLTAVFDQNGDLIGVVPASAIQPVAGASGGKPQEADTDGAAHGVTDAGGGGSVPEPSDAPAGDMQPAPAAAAGTPAEGVAKAEDTAEAEAAGAGVAKAGETSAPQGGKTRKGKTSKVARALAAQEAAHAEVVAKMAADSGEQAQRIEALTARLETVEKSFAPPKVFTSGQIPRGPVPAPEQLRGQDAGMPPVDVAKAAGLKKTLYTGTAREQNAAFGEMQELAVARLQQMHAAGPRPAA